MSKFSNPPDVTEKIRLLGERIRIARIRRGWTALDLATKAGINRNTLAALEHGKPGTALGTCFTVLWVLGLESSIVAIADPDADLYGKALEEAQRPSRVGRPRAAKVGDDYDF